MKKYLSILIVASILGIIMFGFAFAGHEMHHAKVSCLNFALNGTDCPLNMLEFAFHHIESQRTFFNAYFDAPSSLLSMLVLLIVVAAASFAFTKANPNLAEQRVVHSVKRKSESSYIKHKNVLPWLALFERSPSYS